MIFLYEYQIRRRSFIINIFYLNHFLKMIEVENVANESCSPNLIFIKENHFQEDLVDFRH